LLQEEAGEPTYVAKSPERLDSGLKYSRRNYWGPKKKGGSPATPPKCGGVEKNRKHTNRNANYLRKNQHVRLRRAGSKRNPLQCEDSAVHHISRAA